MNKLLLLIPVVVLQGCAGAMLVAGVAGMATVEVTGKSASDHVISAVNGQDCKMSRKMQGRDMCQDQPDAEPVVVARDKPKLDIPPVTPQPKRVVVVSNSVDNMEAVFAQRMAK